MGSERFAQALLNLDMPAWYWDAGVAVTRNLGTLGGTVQLGDGTTVGTFPTQVFPHGMSFDGGDYLMRASESALSFTSGPGVDLPFSLEILVQNSGVSNLPAFISKGAHATSLEYAFYIFSSGNVTFSVMNPTVTAHISRVWIAGTGILADRGITHWVATYDGTMLAAGLAFYRNSQRVDNGTIAAGVYTGMTAGAGSLRIGNFQNISYLTGNVYNAAVYPFALQPGEIAQLYRQRLGLLNRGF